jgi:hypothetical protein
MMLLLCCNTLERERESQKLDRITSSDYPLEWRRGMQNVEEWKGK